MRIRGEKRGGGRGKGKYFFTEHMLFIAIALLNVFYLPCAHETTQKWPSDLQGALIS